MSDLKDMRILEIRVENFMRLKVVRFAPNETVQIVGGENAQGKSSLLNAVLFALDGKRASKEISEPVRHGETYAEIYVDLGDIVVSKIFNGEKWALKVTSPLGAVFTSPAKMLEELVGRLSFDPLDFTRLDAKTQVNALLDTVDLGLDLNALDKERDTLKQSRLEIGRVRDVHEGTLKGLGALEQAPKEEVVVSELLDLYRATEGAWQRKEDLIAKVGNSIRHIEELEGEIARERFEIEQVTKLLADFPELDSLDDVKKQIDDAENTNKAVRANEARYEAKTKFDEFDNNYKAHTKKLEELEAKKAKALREAKFPLEDLSFDENGVTYKGVPLSQISSSEQIKVCLAISMALNPKVKVIYIKDGSLLDSKSMDIIREMAEAQGYQVFIERVGDADEMAIIIEDGEVKK